MNSSGNLHMRHVWLISLLAICGALTACGGGIYGTGSGTENEIGQQAPSGDIDDPAGSDEQPNTEDNGDTVHTDNASLPEFGHGQQTTFSNTVSSGLDLPPQLKLINLSEVPINAYAQDTPMALFDIAAQPQSTSGYSALMPGESVITVINTDTLATIGSVNPLNVAQGSVTSLLIADSLSHSAGLPGILPLSTLVTSAAADMAMVRLVLAADTAATLTAMYTLMPQGPNPGMAEIDFAGMNTTSQRTSNYQLVGAGDYNLTDGTGRTIAGTLSFSPGVVYTVIITDATDSGIYLEVDRAP